MPCVVSKIADEFLLSEAMVRSIVKSAPHRYKVYTVSKRSGRGRRTIAQPAREVKILQRFVVKEFLCDLPIHSAAAAYVTGRGIKDNAAAHVGSRFLLKMDFREFFPSIKPYDLRAHLTSYLPDKFDDDDLNALCDIIFWKPRRSKIFELCIGGPSSPFISNTIVFRFDQEMASFCRERKVIYTRYADDLTFSTNEAGMLSETENFVQDVLTRIDYPKLTINTEKTIHSSKKHHRRVTGLVLSSEGKVSLGRDRKRELRAMLYRSLINHDGKPEIQKLRGYLAFALDVEPTFIESMREKFGRDFIDQILRGRAGR
jgi:hypothetical protein